MPSRVTAESDSKQITISIADYIDEADSGCPILSFEIQMDDGKGGAFTSVTTLPFLDLYYTATKVEKSLVYRFRYRAQNCQGWSTFSPELYVIAAEPPRRCEAAKLVSTSGTVIELKLTPSGDNMGSVVTDYVVYRNQGNND